MPKSETFQQLPAPWDRIFSLFTRLFVWGLLASIIYVLRPFFLLIFLTFVFAYIQSHGVEGLGHRFKNRAYRVSIVFLVFLGVIVGTFYFLAPHVRDQMGEFGNNYPKYARQADTAIYRFVDNWPALKRIMDGKAGDDEEAEGDKKEAGDGKTGPDGKPDVSPPKKVQKKPALPPEKRPPIVEPFVLGLLAQAGSHEKPDKAGAGAGDKTIQDYGDALKSAIAGLAGITSSFLLSILFSFLIVLDLPNLRRGVRGLANTKLDFIYAEVADNIFHFGQRLGRALEAQLFIAICNTVLTAIGLYFMGLPSMVFLASVVFFCSFIPVAGVFISSAPICLLALQAGGNEGGVQLMLIAVVFILLIHAIEAYILNPKIYGHHLRMNAVLVLIVLTVAGKLIGVWGLVLGLPVVNYIFGTAIRRRDDDGDEITKSGTKIPAIEPTGEA